MAAKRKRRDSEFEKMMRNPFGRWFWIPLVIAIMVYGGLAIFAALAQVDKAVPTYAYGAGGVLGAAIYYAVQLKTLFWPAEGSGSTRSTRIHARGGNQTVRGSQVEGPVIRGNKNVVTVIHASPERPAEPKEKGETP